ncbi:unnamed protein product, partial [Cyprideis torosa]
MRDPGWIVLFARRSSRYGGGMLTDVMIEDARWDALGFSEIAEHAATATLQHLGLDPAGFEIAVLACDDARITELNADFRDKPVATNVLSWPSDERAAEEDGEAPDLPDAPEDGPPEELGDIAIAYETCIREAQESDKPIADHVTHLMIHATLHLLGYDHIRDLDAT